MIKLKALFQDSRKRDFYFRWAVRILILIGVVYLALLKDTSRETVFVQPTAARDSLKIEQYKVQVLENILIQNKAQNEKDSTDLTLARVDSLISYVATGMAAGTN
jgi:hypothetical protein